MAEISNKKYILLLLMIISANIIFSHEFYSAENIVIVGGDNNYPPFEFMNDDFMPEGFNVDIIRAIAKTMQIDIELVLEPWAEVVKKLDNSEIDVLQGMFYSDERAEIYLFTAPHIIIHQAVFKRKNAPFYTGLNNLRGKEIIVQNGDIMHEYALKNNLTDKLILTESPEEGLTLLASGKHDFLLTSRITGLYWINELNLNNISAGDNLMSSNYCFAVSKNNKELLNILNEGMIIIQQTGVYNEIYEKWFNELGIRLHNIRKTFKIILISLVLMVSLLLVFVLWLSYLKKNVKIKSEKLEKEIKDHHKTDNELTKSRELYRVLFSDFTDAIILFESTGNRIINFNRKACDLFGYTDEEFINISLSTLKEMFNFDSSRIENHIEKIMLTGFDSFETKIQSKNNSIKYLIVKGKLISIEENDYIQIVLIDITDKKILEEKLLQAGKLEAVGTLAGGIAHDFNNILAAILGYSEIARMQIGENNPGWSEIGEVVKAGNRAKDIVKQILVFSRNDSLKTELVDLCDIIDDSWNFLRAAIPSTVKIIKNADIETDKIIASTTQIYQILLNLCTNASHAMEVSGGTITISTGNSLFEERKYVKLSVSDTGTGLDPKIVDRIYDPYFTTKGVDKGSGLGLAVVHGIVEESGGFIKIDNIPGEGVTFHIFLPASETGYIEKYEQEPEIRGGNEIVLVLDDESAVSDILSRQLESAGYKVLSEINSISAINTFKKNPDKIDLLITDQTMPEKTGLEVAAIIKNINNIPVILTTGYSSVIHDDNEEEEVVDKILFKPISKNKLLKTVREVLDSSNEV
jgi:two-component system sensor histidine kinase EvgS